MLPGTPKTLIAPHLVVGLLLATSGCTIERAVMLYPDNDAAHAIGGLQAKVVGHGNLNGTMTMPLRNGEILRGRYSIHPGGGGEADMMSPQGTTAHCEFENNNFTGHGHGACRLSNGAVYRMQY